MSKAFVLVIKVLVSGIAFEIMCQHQIETHLAIFVFHQGTKKTMQEIAQRLA